MRTPLTTTVAAVLALAAATPALAAEVSAQKTVAKAGEKAPVTVGGTGIKKGAALKSGQTMIAREITLVGRERTSLVMTCAGGTALQGLASAELGDFSWVTAKKTSYVGKRSVRVNVFGRAKPGVEGAGTMYAICRKG